MKTQRERELELELSRFLFDFGRIVLGKDTGGMIAKLKNVRGISSAWNALKDARLTSEPLEYIGAIVREQKAERAEITNEQYEQMLARYKARQARTA